MLPVPHSYDIEKAVLACALYGRADDVLAKCCDADFYRPAHLDIFHALVDARMQGYDVDMVSVKGIMEESSTLNLMALVDLDEDMPAPDLVEQYIDKLKDYSLRRGVMQTGQWMMESSSHAGHSASEIWSESYTRLDSVSQENREGEPRSMRDIVSEFGPVILERKPGDGMGLSTGFSLIDKTTLGLSGGKLHIIAGRPGMGKSVLAQNFAQHAALREDKSVLFFSLEMTQIEILERLCASEAGVSYSAIRGGYLDHRDRSEVQSALGRIEKSKLLIDDTASLSINDIIQRTRRAKKSGGLDLLVVDYLGLISIPEGFSRHDLAIGSMSRSFKVQAKELGIPVVAVAQLSRAVERRDNKRPVLSDLRDSGNLEQDADIVMFVYRESKYNTEIQENVAEVIVAKHRAGQTGIIDMDFDGSHMRFMDAGSKYGPSSSEQQLAF